MSQRAVDLLPESIRVRSQAHVRTGRYIAAAVAVVLVVTASATWSRLALRNARTRVADAEQQAVAVIALEEETANLRGRLDEMRDYITRYGRVSHPLSVSAVLATVVNELPSSVTLDKIAIDAGHRRNGRSPRSQGRENESEPAPRFITAELSGFAASDSDVAEFVERLTGLSPFRRVNLDYSRTRIVRHQPAREFRLSFGIDLDMTYETTYRAASRADEPLGGEVSHVTR